MNQNSAPVFIVGMPRSGTTLLCEILNAHPNIALVRETAFISYWYQILNQFDLRNKQDCTKMWQIFANSVHVRRTGLEIETVKKALLDNPECTLKDVHEAFLRAYATRYNATCWGEKNPQYELHLSTVFSWYPDARVVFMVRDPRAVISSLRRAPWSHGSVWLHATEYRRSHAALVRYRSDNRVHVVRYEELVANQAVVLCKICNHIGQPFSENMLVHSQHEGCQSYRVDQLKYLKNMKWVMKHINDVRSPIHSGALEKWRTELPSRHITIVEHMLRAQMKDLGYECSTTRHTWSVKAGIGIFLSKAAAPVLYFRPRRWYLLLQKYNVQGLTQAYMMIVLQLKMSVHSWSRTYLR